MQHGRHHSRARLTQPCHTPHNRRKEYQLGGDEFLEGEHRRPRYSDEEKRNAVDHYSGHGKSLARTIGAMGYPSRKVLSSWVDERTLVICAVCEKE